MIGAISIYSSSAPMQHKTSRGLQASPAESDAVANFKFENVAGGFITSDDLKGKVTVVDVWATWCPHCAEEIPIYNRLYDAFQGKDVAVVGLASDSPRRDIPSRVRQLGIKYPVLIGNDAAGQPFGRIQGFPTTLVIGKDGKIYKRYMGTVDNKEEKIKQDIEHLLADATSLPSEKITSTRES
jgi:thiol-disulfide isomerase/thioredoxin